MGCSFLQKEEEERQDSSGRPFRTGMFTLLERVAEKGPNSALNKSNLKGQMAWLHLGTNETINI